ncbi:MAG: hypothetical protein JWP36_1032, partial [Paucimonas sp.]|nr:hypothetical protein [Paucimonas sp.]
MAHTSSSVGRGSHSAATASSSTPFQSSGDLIVETQKTPRMSQTPAYLLGQATRELIQTLSWGVSESWGFVRNFRLLARADAAAAPEYTDSSPGNVEKTGNKQSKARSSTTFETLTARIFASLDRNKLMYFRKGEAVVTQSFGQALANLGAMIGCEVPEIPARIEQALYGYGLELCGQAREINPDHGRDV